MRERINTHSDCLFGAPGEISHFRLIALTTGLAIPSGATDGLKVDSGTGCRLENFASSALGFFRGNAISFPDGMPIPSREDTTPWFP